MKHAGAEDMPEDAERKGLGMPATRAAIIEKLVAAGFVERKGKSLIPTRDGINLVTVLPEALTSPMLTAEWEQQLSEIAKSGGDPRRHGRQIYQLQAGISEEEKQVKEECRRVCLILNMIKTIPLRRSLPTWVNTTRAPL